MHFTPHPASAGFSLIESTIAAAISALFLSSVFTLNISTMETIRCAKEGVSASQVLQQRIESLRIANWQQITDPDWIAANLLNADALGAGPLKNLSETLSLIPYGSTSIGNTQLTRTGTGTTIVNRNPNLLTENAIKVIWTVNYTGAPNDHAVSRQIVAILAKGGVAK
jgi:type II secretory pathway pseudopilin PulG